MLSTLTPNFDLEDLSIRITVLWQKCLKIHHEKKASRICIGTRSHGSTSPESQHIYLDRRTYSYWPVTVQMVKVVNNAGIANNRA